MEEVTNYSEILRKKLFEMVQNHGQENVIEKIRKVFQCKTSWAYKLRKQIIGNDISAFNHILYYQPHCSREDLLCIVALWHSSWGDATTAIAGVKEVLNRTITTEELRLMLSLAILDERVVFSAAYLRSRQPPAADPKTYAVVRLQPFTPTDTLLHVRQYFELRNVSQAQLTCEYEQKTGRSARKVDRKLAKVRKSSDTDRKNDPEYGTVQGVRVNNQRFTRGTLSAAKQQVCQLQEEAQRVGMQVYAEIHEGCDMKNISELGVEFLSADLVDSHTPTKPTSL